MFSVNEQDFLLFFLFSGILNLVFQFIFKIGSVYNTCLTDSSLKYVFIRSQIAVQVDYWLQLISGNRRFQSIRLIPQDWLYHLSFRIPQPIPDCQGSRSLASWLLLHKFSYYVCLKATSCCTQRCNLNICGFMFQVFGKLNWSSANTKQLSRMEVWLWIIGVTDGIQLVS